MIESQKKTILIFSEIQIGKDYSQNDLNIILKEIYSTNFFPMYH